MNQTFPQSILPLRSAVSKQKGILTKKPKVGAAGDRAAIEPPNRRSSPAGSRLIGRARGAGVVECWSARSITSSDNPGPPDTHRVPQTFDLRPGALPASIGPKSTPRTSCLWQSGCTQRISFPPPTQIPSSAKCRVASPLFDPTEGHPSDGYFSRCLAEFLPRCGLTEPFGKMH